MRSMCRLMSIFAYLLSLYLYLKIKYISEVKGFLLSSCAGIREVIERKKSELVCDKLAKIKYIAWKIEVAAVVKMENCDLHRISRGRFK